MLCAQIFACGCLWAQTSIEDVKFLEQPADAQEFAEKIVNSPSLISRDSKWYEIHLLRKDGGVQNLAINSKGELCVFDGGQESQYGVWGFVSEPEGGVYIMSKASTYVNYNPQMDENKFQSVVKDYLHRVSFFESNHDAFLSFSLNDESIDECFWTSNEYLTYIKGVYNYKPSFIFISDNGPELSEISKTKFMYGKNRGVNLALSTKDGLLFISNENKKPSFGQKIKKNDYANVEIIYCCEEKDFCDSQRKIEMSIYSAVKTDLINLQKQQVKEKIEWERQERIRKEEDERRKIEQEKRNSRIAEIKRKYAERDSISLAYKSSHSKEIQKSKASDYINFSPSGDLLSFKRTCDDGSWCEYDAESGSSYDGTFANMGTSYGAKIERAKVDDPKALYGLDSYNKFFLNSNYCLASYGIDVWTVYLPNGEEYDYRPMMRDEDNNSVGPAVVAHRVREKNGDCHEYSVKPDPDYGRWDYLAVSDNLLTKIRKTIGTAVVEGRREKSEFRITYTDGSEYEGSITIGNRIMEVERCSTQNQVDSILYYVDGVENLNQIAYYNGVLCSKDNKIKVYVDGTVDVFESNKEQQVRDKQIQLEKQKEKEAKAILNQLIAKYGKSTVDAVFKGQIKIGLPEELFQYGILTKAFISSNISGASIYKNSINGTWYDIYGLFGEKIGTLYFSKQKLTTIRMIR